MCKLKWRFGLKEKLITPIVQEKLDNLEKLGVEIFIRSSDSMGLYGIEHNIDNSSDDKMSEELFNAFDELYQVI